MYLVLYTILNAVYRNYLRGTPAGHVFESLTAYCKIQVGKALQLSPKKSERPGTGVANVLIGGGCISPQFCQLSCYDCGESTLSLLEHFIPFLSLSDA